MKDLVVDSGVAVKWFVAEDDSPQVLQILRDYRSEKFSFLAPDLLYAEFGNIIWKKVVFNNLDPNDADFAISEFKRISFTLSPITLLFDNAYKIAVKHKRTFYDSLYLALSVRENCEFVTADEKFYNSVRGNYPKIILLADWNR
ncbi:MAG TPA: type II toxin-antitoxin system VapC family toxin [Pyrinomonadaceae bacterium]|nr:type II toxin-antitoxin system VapC family toxin [Pyrinomonadaceae bacterium]